LTKMNCHQLINLGLCTYVAISGINGLGDEGFMHFSKNCFKNI